MPDKQPTIMGSNVPGGLGAGGGGVSQADFDLLVVRVDNIELRAVDQVDFDAEVAALRNYISSVETDLRSLESRVTALESARGGRIRPQPQQNVET